MLDLDYLIKWIKENKIEIPDDLGTIFPNYYRFQKNIVKAIRKLKFIKKSVKKYGFEEYKK